VAGQVDTTLSLLLYYAQMCTRVSVYDGKHCSTKYVVQVSGAFPRELELVSYCREERSGVPTR
jgi:hypothetical protein